MQRILASCDGAKGAGPPFVHPFEVKKLASAGSIAGALMVACSTSSTSSGAAPGATDGGFATPSTVCSDGPRWPGGTNFEYERDGPFDAPACTPHCGPNKAPSAMWASFGNEALTSEALPSGACSEDGVVCTMLAEWLGACPAEAQAIGPLDNFICRCKGGSWKCTIDASSPSATGFSCVMPDGTQFIPGQQADGGTDASAVADAD